MNILSSTDLIVVFAGDPGGAKSLIPVIKELLKLEVKLEIIGYYHAVKIWRDCFFDVLEVDCAKSLIKKLSSFQNSRPACLLLGTSVNDLNLECDAIKWAENNSVPSLSVLDYWSNYRSRFMSEQEVFCLPTAIAVMDDLAKQKMLQEGFPHGVLHVSGMLSLNNIRQYFLDQNERLLLRNFLSASTDSALKYDYVFVFVSQPISSFYAQKSLKTAAPPFDEVLVLNDFIAALDQFVRPKKLKAKILVRLHPRESHLPKFQPTEFVDVFLANNSCDGAELSAYDYVQAADVVLGMNSMLLLESCYLGATVVSYQPFLTKNLDVLPSNLNGLSVAVYNFEQLGFYLQEAICLSDSKKLSQQVIFDDDSSVRKILELIVEITNKGSSYEK